MALLAEDLPRNPEPYHTSALLGEAWLIELIVGHPDHICCKLGVGALIFRDLTLELQSQGHHDS
jgi:hypothetical protein